MYLLSSTQVSAEDGQPLAPPTGVDQQADQQRWAAVPIIASSPETGLMLGGMVFHFLPVNSPGEQASTIDLVAYGTAEGQYGLSISPNIFLASGKYRFNAALGGSFWKANYFAPGNDSPEVSEEYEASTLAAIFTLERRWLNALVFDLKAFYEKNEMEVVPNGMLATGLIPGAQDANLLGLGVEGGYDTRDNTNSPTSGVVALYSYVKFGEGMGSDLDFTVQNLDLRYFKEIGKTNDSVLALAATVKRAAGEVPFRQLSSPDGTLILRGIENGRYMDRNMIALQSEYRFPIYKKISGTLFAEAAQLAPRLGDMKISEFKSSLGSGFRYALNPDQRFNLRADIAWVDGGIGVVVNFREAF